MVNSRTVHSDRSKTLVYDAIFTLLDGGYNIFKLGYSPLICGSMGATRNDNDGRD